MQKEEEKKVEKVDLTVEIPYVKEDAKDEFKPESADVPSPELTWEEPDDEVQDYDKVMSESDDEDVVDVERMEWNGVEYLRDDNGVVYDIESQDSIGHWDEDDERVVLYNES